MNASSEGPIGGPRQFFGRTDMPRIITGKVYASIGQPLGDRSNLPGDDEMDRFISSRETSDIHQNSPLGKQQESSLDDEILDSKKRKRSVAVVHEKKGPSLKLEDFSSNYSKLLSQRAFGKKKMSQSSQKPSHSRKPSGASSIAPKSAIPKRQALNRSITKRDYLTKQPSTAKRDGLKIQSSSAKRQLIVKPASFMSPTQSSQLKLNQRQSSTAAVGKQSRQSIDSTKAKSEIGRSKPKFGQSHSKQNSGVRPHEQETKKKMENLTKLIEADISIHKSKIAELKSQNTSMADFSRWPEAALNTDETGLRIISSDRRNEAAGFQNFESFGADALEGLNKLTQSSAHPGMRISRQVAGPTRIEKTGQFKEEECLLSPICASPVPEESTQGGVQPFSTGTGMSSIKKMAANGYLDDANKFKCVLIDLRADLNERQSSYHSQQAKSDQKSMVSWKSRERPRNYGGNLGSSRLVGGATGEPSAGKNLLYKLAGGNSKATMKKEGLNESSVMNRSRKGQLLFGDFPSKKLDMTQGVGRLKELSSGRKKESRDYSALQASSIAEQKPQTRKSNPRKSFNNSVSNFSPKMSIKTVKLSLNSSRARGHQSSNSSAVAQSTASAKQRPSSKQLSANPRKGPSPRVSKKLSTTSLPRGRVQTMPDRPQVLITKKPKGNESAVNTLFQKVVSQQLKASKPPVAPSERMSSLPTDQMSISRNETELLREPSSEQEEIDKRKKFNSLIQQCKVLSSEKQASLEQSLIDCRHRPRPEMQLKPPMKKSLAGEAVSDTESHDEQCSNAGQEADHNCLDFYPRQGDEPEELPIEQQALFHPRILDFTAGVTSKVADSYQDSVLEKGQSPDSKADFENLEVLEMSTKDFALGSLEKQSPPASSMLLRQEEEKTDEARQIEMKVDEFNILDGLREVAMREEEKKEADDKYNDIALQELTPPRQKGSFAVQLSPTSSEKKQLARMDSLLDEESPLKKLMSKADNLQQLQPLIVQSPPFGKNLPFSKSLHGKPPRSTSKRPPSGREKKEQFDSAQTGEQLRGRQREESKHRSSSMPKFKQWLSEHKSQNSEKYAIDSPPKEPLQIRTTGFKHSLDPHPSPRGAPSSVTDPCSEAMEAQNDEEGDFQMMDLGKYFMGADDPEESKLVSDEDGGTLLHDFELTITETNSQQMPTDVPPAHVMGSIVSQIHQGGVPWLDEGSSGLAASVVQPRASTLLEHTQEF